MSGTLPCQPPDPHQRATAPSTRSTASPSRTSTAIRRGGTRCGNGTLVDLELLELVVVLEQVHLGLLRHLGLRRLRHRDSRHGPARNEPWSRGENRRELELVPVAVGLGRSRASRRTWPLNKTRRTPPDLDPFFFLRKKKISSQAGAFCL